MNMLACERRRISGGRFSPPKSVKIVKMIEDIPFMQFSLFMFQMCLVNIKRCLPFQKRDWRD